MAIEKIKIKAECKMQLLIGTWSGMVAGNDIKNYYIAYVEGSSECCNL